MPTQTKGYMKAPNDQELLLELKQCGFDEETIKTAIRSVSEKNIETVIAYIEKMQKARGEIKSRVADDEDAEKLKREEKDKRLEERRKKEIERIKENLHLQRVKEQIKAERELKIEEELNSSGSISSENVLKTAQITINNPDQCKIRVRFAEGGSKVFTFDKKENLSVLFKKLDEHYGGKKFNVFDANLVQVMEEEKSLDSAGFFPSTVINAKKN